MDIILTEWIGSKYYEKCDRQFCKCRTMPALQPILQAPPKIDIESLAHWHKRASELLGEPVTILVG